jgi:hypothetical protein
VPLGLVAGFDTGPGVPANRREQARPVVGRMALPIDSQGSVFCASGSLIPGMLPQEASFAI